MMPKDPAASIVSCHGHFPIGTAEQISNINEARPKYEIGNFV